MLLTLSTTAPPATDLGFLLHKHPDRAQSFTVTAGTAHVFWPAATPSRATAALLVEIDPVGLVRGGRSGPGPAAQYVSDRPYAASSLLSVALGSVFRTAMAGRCAARPDLVDRPLPLEVHLPALPSRGGAELVTRLFAPLGWAVDARPVPLDPEIAGWGDSPYVDLRLSGALTVADALTQLYVLVPVLDDAKHYWLAAEEVDKLLRAGGRWLPGHPERELITRRYLGHRRALVHTAIDRLAEVDDLDPDDLDPDDLDPGSLDPLPRETEQEQPLPLARLRRAAVLAALRAEGASSVVDLGCGGGALLGDLLDDAAFTTVLGVDVAPRALELAARRLHLDRMPEARKARLRLLQSSVTYRDDRLAGYDAVVLMEVVEHLDPERLPALVRNVFGHARPRSVVVTTPNVEYNVRYEGLAAGATRHRDHRFEWTRAEFRAWADGAASGHGYAVRHLPVGADDPEVGPPTQLAVFRLAA